MVNRVLRVIKIDKKSLLHKLIINLLNLMIELLPGEPKHIERPLATPIPNLKPLQTMIKIPLNNIPLTKHTSLSQWGLPPNSNLQRIAAMLY